MTGGVICPNTNIITKDPRFEGVKDAYKHKHYPDGFLSNALIDCRTRYEKDDNWFPTEGKDKALFTYYINNIALNPFDKPAPRKPTGDSLQTIYSTLYDVFTPEQLDDRLDDLAHKFRAEVDKLENADTANRSRQELIELQGDEKNNGYVVIINRVFDKYEKNYDYNRMLAKWKADNPSATPEQLARKEKFFRYVADQYALVLEHRNRLAALVAPRIGESEGFRVDIQGFEVSMVSEDETEDAENTNTDNGEDRTEGSKGDRYGDFRTVKLINTLSSRARRLLSNIVRIDKNGKPVYSDVGAKKYIDVRQAIMSLQKSLVNSTPDTMISDLEDASDYYPWMRELVRMLNEDTDLRTTIYCASKKAENLYLYTDTDNGSLQIKLANSRSRGNAMMQEAGNNLRGGFVQDENYSIYTGYGSLVSANRLSDIRSRFSAVAKEVKDFTATIRLIDGEGVMREKVIDAEIERLKKEYGDGDYSYLKLSAKDAMRQVLAHNPDIVSEITGFARGLGFTLREKDIIEMAVQPISRRNWKYLNSGGRSQLGHNRLFQLVNEIESMHTSAEKAIKNTPTGQYLYNVDSEGFRKINSLIALSQYMDVEPRTLVEDKAVSAYNNVNPLHQIFDLLGNRAGKEEEAYQKELEDEFLRYEGYAIGTGKHRQVYGWLKMLRENPASREAIRVYDGTSIFHKDYSRMSRQQKLLNQMAMFFNGHSAIRHDGYGLYEYPIQSDYSTAYNFISALILRSDKSVFDMKEGETSALIEALVDEVLLENDRISAIERRACKQIYGDDGKLVDNPDYDPNRARLTVYEKQGMKFQIFPAFNDNKLRSAIRGMSSEDTRNYIREAVKEQLRDVVTRDFATIEKSGVLSHRYIRNLDIKGVSLYVENGKVDGLKAAGKLALENYFLNTYYARQQMTKLVVGGTEQFNGLIDFEKRNMFSHATHTSLFTKATWKGKQVGKETQKAVYVEDDVVASSLLDGIADLLHQLLDEGWITKEQYNTMLDAYKSIKTTDGQAMRTLDSHRVNMIMADQWNDRMESAYNNIKAGNPTKGDIDLYLAQVVKPIFNGYEHVEAAKGDGQKPVKLTVLHKYAEMILLPQELAKYCLQTKSVPLQAFEAANQALGGDVDVFLFHSCVKVGYHSGLTPFAKWSDIEDNKETGETAEEIRKRMGWNGEPLNERIRKSTKSITDYIVSSVRSNRLTVHTLPYKYYGIAASTPAHVADDNIAWASQAEKVAWANVLKGQKITVNGREMDAWDARELYFDIKTANIIDDFDNLRKLFRSPWRLEKLFREEIAQQGYNSDEMLYVLSRLQDGSFALPLFSPNVEHQVQQILSSIIRKRLTKTKSPGANILQTTSLGMDIDASMFDNKNALTEDQKLNIVFEGTGKNRRIKYVEVFLPLFDTRLKQFADENGNIGPDRLKKLIEDKVIPEDVIQFIAYRTPSDAEHSIIPCRVKGFMANTGGATIILPKEIMNMTGHDYDGDKLRCHFADFKVVWDEDRIHREYLKYKNGSSEEEIVRYILGLSEHAYMPEEYEDISEAEFAKRFKRRERELNSVKYKKVEYEQYDYDKSAMSNTRTARENARVQLMFSKLTSPEGSRRMVIPGGCDPTKVYAKTLYLVRSAREHKNKVKIGKLILAQENEKKKRNPKANVLSAEDISAAVNTTDGLYKLLIKRSDSELTAIMRSVMGTETAFSVTHAADAYDYIMGGAEMIGIYALYNSAMQMFQRLNLRYVPSRSKKNPKNVCNVTLFGNTFGGEGKKLFEVRNSDDELAILGLARLLNAAVDNNKDPLLGHLNQTKEMAEMTFFLFANGVTEEEIHLIMNQPVVRELIERLKGQNSLGFKGEIIKLLEELKENRLWADISEWKGVENVGKMSKDDFIKNLDKTFDDMQDDSKRFDLIEPQINILQFLSHLYKPASTLAEFAKLTRPESESGAIGSSVQDLIVKVSSLKEFRDALKSPNADQELGISGMEEVIKLRDIWEEVDTDYIRELIENNLPEVVALNTLMLDFGLEMFRPYFPQVKDTWVDLTREVLGGYSNLSEKQKIALAGKIGNEMILFKLLSSKKFVRGDSQEEQKRILGYDKTGGVPYNLKTLKERIAKAGRLRDTLERNGIAPTRKDGVLGYYDKKGNWHEMDEVADRLIGNVFLKKLTFTSPEWSSVPRIRFDLGGPAVENQADTIRHYWGELLNSKDEAVRQLAIDLFKYNLYTNGFSYGMYEFSHFAPFNVIRQTPGYVDALNEILRKSTWKNAEERENFINQYYMNHWGDDKFVPRISDWFGIKRKAGDQKGEYLILKDSDPAKLAMFEGARYIVDEMIVAVDGKKTAKEYTLYRVSPGNNEAAFVLHEATKLGVRNRSGQVTLQYNPSVSYDAIEPVAIPNDSPWAELRTVSPRDAYAESDITAPDDRREQPAPEPDMKAGANAYAALFIEQQSKKLNALEEKAKASNPKNETVLADHTTPTGTPAPISLDDEMVFEKPDASAVYDFSALGFNVSPEKAQELAQAGRPADKKLNIVRYDERGNLVSENVPASMNNISLARRQKVFVELNKRLREILRDKGIGVGALTHAEARMSLGGVADFDTAAVTAEGLREMIRIANGYEGEQALPEEFAHLALEMLGHDHPLVRRLLDELSRNESALQEAFNGMYDEYAKEYENDRDKLILEAAGKLVAKNLFMQQEIETKPVRNLIQRIVDAIKSLFRRFRREEVEEAIFEANGIASKIAREMLGGKLIDDMSVDNIQTSGSLLKKVAQDLSGKEDILSKLLKREVKRLSVFKKRLAYNQKTTASKALDDTETEILKLQAAIRNHKTEAAVIEYLKDGLQFLTSTNDSLVSYIQSGAKVNSICRKLNIVRDTLYSYSQAIEDIRKAIAEGELQDTQGLSDAMMEIEHKLGGYFASYNRIAMRYFEEMLSSVYGEKGLEVTIGRDKGRKISIYEMARRADHDISFASRWFNSIADCDDYVLKAIDDVVRDAKIRSRQRAAEIRKKIEVAYADLLRETGSTDQDFMFEKVVEPNGKIHRTGLYISESAADKLPDAQKKFYKAMMAIKEEADDCLPESLIEDRKIVMLRKNTMEKFKSAEGRGDKALIAWEGLKNRVMDMSDDRDYEYEEVTKDFEGNKVDMLPVKFLLKGKHESYDDMTDDVATSMMAYVGMAFEYDEMNDVINVLENAKYMASQRDIVQKTGWRTQRESVGNPREDYAAYREPFTVKQARSRTQDALNDFFQMHVYGHLQKDEGTIGNTNISVRGAVNTANWVASLSQMAVNLSQRIANVSTGMTQIVIESAGNGVYNVKDLVRASAIYTRNSGDRLAETGKTDPDNKLSLFDEKFDIHQDNGRKGPDFRKSRLGRIFNTSLLYAGLTIGEDYLSNMTAIAAALNYKMLDADGNESNLWEAYEVKYTDPSSNTGAYLSLKPGWKKADGTELTAEDERAFAKSVIGLNFDLQGIYNEDDRSAIQQHAFGALLIMYRKWIAPALKRRYGRTQYSQLKGQYEEGYYTTLWNHLRKAVMDTREQVSEQDSANAMMRIVGDCQTMINNLRINWSKLSAYEKSNIHKSLTEFAIVIGLWAATALLGKIPPAGDDDDRGKMLKWWDKTVMSQLFRLRTEIGSQAPTPMMVSEATKILKSPFAALRPIQDALNIFKLMVPSNYWTDIKSGRYKGHTKAYKYFHELPGVSMWKRIDNFIDPSPLINYYKNEAY